MNNKIYNIINNIDCSFTSKKHLVDLIFLHSYTKDLDKEDINLPMNEIIIPILKNLKFDISNESQIKILNQLFKVDLEFIKEIDIKNFTNIKKAINNLIDVENFKKLFNRISDTQNIFSSEGFEKFFYMKTI